MAKYGRGMDRNISFKQSRDRKTKQKDWTKSDRKETKYSDRQLKHGSKNRRDFEMTSVTCSACKAKCEVPFKPTSSKPVYCSNCFGKRDHKSPNKNSGKDFDIINEKLDKIMEALDIK